MTAVPAHSQPADTANLANKRLVLALIITLALWSSKRWDEYLIRSFFIPHPLS